MIWKFYSEHWLKEIENHLKNKCIFVSEPQKSKLLGLALHRVGFDSCICPLLWGLLKIAYPLWGADELQAWSLFSWGT